MAWKSVGKVISNAVAEGGKIGIAISQGLCAAVLKLCCNCCSCNCNLTDFN